MVKPTKNLNEYKARHKDRLGMKAPIEEWEEVCAGCGTIFMQTQLGALSDAIQQHKPVCGYDCNKALGQVR